MRPKGFLCLVAFVLQAAAAVSQAATVSYTSAFDLRESVSIASTGSFTRTASVPLPLFDASLGDLSEVRLTRNLMPTFVQVLVSNTSEQEQIANLQALVMYRYLATPSAPFLNLEASFGGDVSVSVPGNTADMLVAGGGGPSPTVITSVFSGSSLPQFIGRGVFDHLPQVDGAFSVFQFGPNVSARAVLPFAGDFTVTYTYTPSQIPEPASAGLLTLGCLLLGAVWRRRLKR